MQTDQAFHPNSQQQLSVELLRSGKIWTVINQQHTAPILQKTYYAEYIAPGAAIGGN